MSADPGWTHWEVAQPVLAVQAEQATCPFERRYGWKNAPLGGGAFLGGSQPFDFSGRTVHGVIRLVELRSYLLPGVGAFQRLMSHF